MLGVVVALTIISVVGVVRISDDHAGRGSVCV